MDWLVLAPGLVIIVAVSTWLSVIDWREHRLPNNIVGPLAAGVALWIIILGLFTPDVGRAMTAFGWGFAGFGVFFVLHLVAGLGMGDAKYAWPVCATLGWFGWPSLQTAVIVLALSGGIAGAVTQVRKKGSAQIAYGPFMAFGLVCGIVHGLTTI